MALVLTRSESFKSCALAIIEERLHLLSKSTAYILVALQQTGEEHSPDGMQVSLILTMENDG